MWKSRLKHSTADLVWCVSMMKHKSHMIFLFGDQVFLASMVVVASGWLGPQSYCRCCHSSNYVCGSCLARLHICRQIMESGKVSLNAHRPYPWVVLQAFETFLAIFLIPNHYQNGRLWVGPVGTYLPFFFRASFLRSRFRLLLRHLR